MKVSNTSERLKQYMSKYHLKQVDIIAKAKPYCEENDVKMNKSDISQYVSGKTEPNQDKLFVLARALNVSEAWLMGYDEDETPSSQSTIVLKYDYSNGTKLDNYLDNEELAVIECLRKIDNETKLQVFADLEIPTLGENKYKKLSELQRIIIQDFLFKNSSNEKELKLLQKYSELNCIGENKLIEFLNFLLTNQENLKNNPQTDKMNA